MAHFKFLLHKKSVLLCRMVLYFATIQQVCAFTVHAEKIELYR